MINKESKKISGLFRNNSTCIISIIIVGLFMISFMIRFRIAPFGTKSFMASDAYHQIFPLLSVLCDKMKNGESFFYYWNSGLGGDFLPSYFYYLASPFNLLVCFINKTDINSFISIMISLKIVLSAGTFGYFISRKDGVIENKSVYIAFSCAYALNSFICNYYFFSFWLDSIMVFPLIMLGYERLVNEKKVGLYTCSLAYSLYCNYYISYIICLFLVLWFLIDEYSDIKDFINKGIRFAFFSVLSAGIAAISLIPSYIGLTKTISMSNNPESLHWYGNIFEVIRNMFILPKPYKSTYIDNVANIYCGTFAILLLFSYIFVKEIKLSRKIKILSLLVFILISMDESILNYVWHGFHIQNNAPNRFAFLFIFLLLYVSSDCINAIKSNEKSVVIGLFLAMLLPIISFVFVEFDSIVTSQEIIIVTEVLVTVYTVLILVYSLKDGILKKISGIIFTSLMVLELCFNAFLLLDCDLLDTKDNISYIVHLDEAYNIEDSCDFYRSDINEGIIYNENSYHGMNGVEVFNSTVNGNIPSFMKSMGAHIGINTVLHYQMSDILNNILGVKYCYAYNGDMYYDDNNNYDKIYSDDVFSIYKNRYSLSLGYAVDDNIKDFEYHNNYDLSLNINNLSSCMLNGTELITRVSPDFALEYSGCEIGIGDSAFFAIQYTDIGEKKSITASFHPAEEGLYYMDVREDNEDLITLMINDQFVREHIRMSNGLCRIGYINPNDEVKIIISDNTGHAFQKNNSVSEVGYFIYKIDDEAIKSFSDTLSKQQMTISDFKNDRFKAAITLDKNQVLFTSIPYDKGWHVYEDGKEIKPIIIAGTFLGLDLGEGEHELSFRFIPEGIYLGIFISVISWIIFLIILIASQKKKTTD